MKSIFAVSRAGFHGGQNKMLLFLKPSLSKISLAFILLYVSGLLWRSFVMARVSDTFPVGFPFQFYLSWGPCPPGQDCSEFNALFLILDLLIWYAVSTFIVQRLQKGQ